VRCTKKNLATYVAMEERIFNLSRDENIKFFSAANECESELRKNKFNFPDFKKSVDETIFANSLFVKVRPSKI
jgi:hypothetical protein